MRCGGRPEFNFNRRRVESFADDLNTRRGIVSGRVALLPRSTEIQPYVASIRPSPKFSLSMVNFIRLGEEEREKNAKYWRKNSLLLDGVGVSCLRVSKYQAFIGTVCENKTKNN